MAGDYPTAGFTHPLSEAPASSTRRRIRLDVAFDPLECGPHASDVGPAAGSPQNCPVDSVRPTGGERKRLCHVYPVIDGHDLVSPGVEPEVANADCEGEDAAGFTLQNSADGPVGRSRPFRCTWPRNRTPTAGP